MFRLTTSFGAMTALLCLPLTASEGPDLFQAIRNNDIATLKTYVKDGASAGAKDKRGATLLMHAAAFGSPEAMQVLLDRGADVNEKNDFDATALHWAAGDPVKARLLIERGASVNAVSKQKRTPLMIAAAHANCAATLRLMLSKGADPNALDAMHNNAINAAALTGDLEAVRLLLEKGADVNSTDGGGFTPIANAVGSANLELVKFLLAKGAKVNTANTFGGKVKFGPIALVKITPLMMASAHGTAEMVKTLLDAGADVAPRDSRGMTALMFAVASETYNVEVVAMLLKAGSEVNARSNAGETALDWALKFNHPGVLAALRSAHAETAAAYSAPPRETVKPLDARAAVTKSVALLQRNSNEFFKQSGCVACHHQNITAMAVQAVRTNGLPVSEALSAEQYNVTKFGWATFSETLLQRIDPPGGSDMTAYSLLGMAAAGHKGDSVSDAMVANLAATQQANGSWFMSGVSRAPLTESTIGRTTLAVRCLQQLGMPGRQAEFDQRVARARAWLLEAKPSTTDDYTMRLLGLAWTHADPQAVRTAALQLAALQRSDGGWGQNPNNASDAYATGEALYAMQQAGALAPTDAAYRKGTEYLLSTQHADGSWYVRSRSPKFQPYFQSGFPYDHDQWISTSATAWATMALAPAAAAQQSASVR